jgi:hypothetical protein
VNLVQRTAVRTINGLLQGGTRLWHWTWETAEGRERIRQTGRRVLGVATVGYSLYRLAGRWHWIGAAAVAVALVLAYRSGDPAAEEDPDPTEEEPDDVEAEPSVEELRDALIATVRELAGPDRGVHLYRVHQHWQRPDAPPSTLSEFRQNVEHLGIPVRDSLKAGGTTRIGIHLDDLPPASSSNAADAQPAGPPPAVPKDLFQDW